MAFGDHWTDRWLGRRWIEGEYDCVDFVREVQRDEFGRRLRLPGTPESVPDWDRTVADLKALHAVSTLVPADGDGVLMMQAGGRRQRGFHLGVAVIRDGRRLALHCPRNGSSVLTAVKDLRAAFQLKLEGFYRWI